VIHVEDIFFKTDELIRANSLHAGYEDFMIMSIESPKRYGDFLTVQPIYVGDTEHYEDKILSQKDLDDGAMTHSISSDVIEKMVKTASLELGDDGYVYVCRREDDDFAFGICSSPDPLKKATTEEWENI
jgi:hypothetical protein